MFENLNEKLYFTATLIAVVGIPAATFRAWRNRNGLFPETTATTGWNEFSTVDICVAKMVKNFIGNGFTAQGAIDRAETLRPSFDSLIGEIAIGGLDGSQFDLAILLETNNKWEVFHPNHNTLGGNIYTKYPEQQTFEIVRIGLVFLDVMKAIVELGHDRLASSEEDNDIVKEAWANVFGDNEEENKP